MKLSVNVPEMISFQSCSKNYTPCRTLVAMVTRRKIFENLLLQNHKAKSLHILYVAFAYGLLSRIFKWWPWCQYWPCPGVPLIYIDIQRKTLKFFSTRTIKPRSLISVCSVCSWSTIKIVWIMALGSILVSWPSTKIVQTELIFKKTWLPWGRATFPYKVFLSETTN